MSSIPNLAAAATTTLLQSTGNANANGTHLDLATYKGPVTFVLAVGGVTNALQGPAHVNVASIEDSADNSTFAAHTNFTSVVNTSNLSNAGVQLKSIDVRSLARYVRVRTEVSGTNVNIPLSVIAIGLKERV
jgi:hypothetical protein